MKPKDLFGLAVRVLGLVFLYLGLRGLAAPTFTDMSAIRNDSADDVISTLLPVGINLVVAGWLLGSNFLVRRAYPEPAPGRTPSLLPSAPPAPSAPPVPAPAESVMEVADKRLAALTEKPRPATSVAESPSTGEST